MVDLAAASRNLRNYAGYTMSAALSLLAAGLLSCQAVIWLKPLSPNLSLIEQFAVHLLSLAAVGMSLALVLRRWIQTVILAVLAATLAWPVLAAHRPAAEIAEGPRLKVVVGQPVVRCANARADHRVSDGKRRGHCRPDRSVRILATGTGAAVREVSAQGRLFRDGTGVRNDPVVEAADQSATGRACAWRRAGRGRRRSRLEREEIRGACDSPGVAVYARPWPALEGRSRCGACP